MSSSRFRSHSPTPAELASEQKRRDVSEVLSVHASTQIRDYLKLYDNLFKPSKSIMYTSSKTTTNILKNARVPYFPPYKPEERTEAIKKAAIEHQDVKGVTEVARREVDREVSIALKRIQNKQLKDSIHQGHKKALSEKIKKLDENVDYIVALYKTINTKRSKEDEERSKLQDKMKQVRQDQIAQLKRVREEFMQEKIDERRKVQEISQLNQEKIRKQNEELMAENQQRKQRILQTSKSHATIRDRFTQSSLKSNQSAVKTESTPKSKIEDQIVFANKVLHKLKDEEAKIEESLRHSISESIRMKTELGLIIVKNHNTSRAEHDQSITQQNQSIVSNQKL